MSPTEQTQQKPTATDERVKEMSRFRAALIRPELGSICGVILVFVFFFLTARDSGMFSPAGVMNWSIVSAQFIIIAVGACLLMIAGEFDLSVGSMIGFSGMSIALLSVSFGWPVWLAIIATFVLCVAIGAFNGWIVIKTGLPSFIVTLAFLFILRGLTIFAAIATTRKTIIGGVRDVAEGHWLLTKTKFGNWIFAAGGDAQAARYVGVPVNRVKIMMFMFTAFCACVFATAQVMEFGSAGADRGLLKEFEAIISVVIGGALLTGGYGSVIGAALGAIVFGVVQQGLFFAGVESSLFRVFLGVILLLAVILNTYIRRMITGEK